MPCVTIVMYHYVRDLSRTRYSGLKALSVEAFEGQLDYLTAHYSICTTREVIAAIRRERMLPPNACLLTFDDGFLDHFTTVFPRLVERGLSASFYPPAAAVDGRKVLDTHKIQFILAAVPDNSKLVRQILSLCEVYRTEHDLPSGEQLYQEYARPFRFDGSEVVFIKRVLQRGLPEAVRSTIVQRLFEEYVAVDEQVFAQELYMDISQLRCMLRAGMEIGGHGTEHLWLGSLSREQQEREISQTVCFLARVYGADPVDWVMCYPFGSYDATTLRLLADAKCRLGLTTRVGIADNLASPMELPRLDTNDLPMQGDVALSHWTVKTLELSRMG